MKRVDLNVDIGEGFPHDEALLEFATSANICCGEHAGSWELTVATIEFCKAKGIRIGAHPGYPDRDHMGRKSPSRIPPEWIESIVASVQKFESICSPAYIKPHGALYNDSAVLPDIDWSVPRGSVSHGSSFDPRLSNLEVLNPAAYAVLTCLIPTFILMGLPGTLHEKILWMFHAPYSRARFIREGFADRSYRSDGTLVPRSEPNAVLHDPEEIAAQVLRIAPNVDSICLHGDTPNCVDFAELIYKTLADEGYEVGY